MCIFSSSLVVYLVSLFPGDGEHAQPLSVNADKYQFGNSGAPRTVNVSQHATEESSECASRSSRVCGQTDGAGLPHPVSMPSLHLGLYVFS